MNAIRERAKEHFPTVLLTLLSIVQALALELFWSHLVDASALSAPLAIPALHWLQLVCTLTGIILIWVVYVSNVLRFRWVPTTADSVLPFFIGIIEFLQIEMLGTDSLGQWLLLMAVVFAMMNWIAHKTMRNARGESDNDAFFSQRQPATLRDFYPAIATVGALTLAGSALLITGDQGPFAMIVVLATAALLAWQLRSATQFWNQSVADE